MHYINLVRYGRIKYDSLKIASKELDRLENTIKRMDIRSRELEEALAKREAQYHRWKAREPEVTHYLGVLTDMAAYVHSLTEFGTLIVLTLASENLSLRNQLKQLGHTAPTSNYVWKRHPDAKLKTEMPNRYKDKWSPDSQQSKKPRLSSAEPPEFIADWECRPTHQSCLSSSLMPPPLLSSVHGKKTMSQRPAQAFGSCSNTVITSTPSVNRSLNPENNGRGMPPEIDRSRKTESRTYLAAFSDLDEEPPQTSEAKKHQPRNSKHLSPHISGSEHEKCLSKLETQRYHTSSQLHNGVVDSGKSWLDRSSSNSMEFIKPKTNEVQRRDSSRSSRILEDGVQKHEQQGLFLSQQPTKLTDASILKKNHPSIFKAYDAPFETKVNERNIITAREPIRREETNIKLPSMVDPFAERDIHSCQRPIFGQQVKPRSFLNKDCVMHYEGKSHWTSRTKLPNHHHPSLNGLSFITEPRTLNNRPIQPPWPLNRRNPYSSTSELSPIPPTVLSEEENSFRFGEAPRLKSLHFQPHAQVQVGKLPLKSTKFAMELAQPPQQTRPDTSLSVIRGARSGFPMLSRGLHKCPPSSKSRVHPKYTRNRIFLD